jgi:hypothetical protein
MDMDALRSLTSAKSPHIFEELVRRNLIYEVKLKRGRDTNEEDKKESKDYWVTQEIVALDCYLQNGQQKMYLYIFEGNPFRGTIFTSIQVLEISFKSDDDITYSERVDRITRIKIDNHL